MPTNQFWEISEDPKTTQGTNVTTSEILPNADENINFNVKTGTGLYDDLNIDFGSLKNLKIPGSTTDGITPPTSTVDSSKIDDAADAVSGADVFDQTKPNFDKTTKEMKLVGQAGGVDFKADDFDTDYSSFVNTIAGIGKTGTDLSGIADVNIDVSDVKNQLLTLSNQRVDSNLVGGVEVDYGNAVRLIQGAGRGPDVKALMETGMSLQSAIDRILGSAEDISVEGLRDVDTGIAEIEMLRDMGLTGITQEDIDKIRSYREENKFTDNMEQAIGLLRDYSIGQSEVDRKIAEGQLADFDAASKANIVAERQKLLTDPTLSDSAKRAALGVLNRNVGIARSKLQSEIAKTAADRAFLASEKYAAASQGAAEFNEGQFNNDILAVSNMWGKKIDAITAAGGLRGTEIQADITKESTITDILGDNANRALSAAVESGALTAKEKDLLLAKETTLAELDNTKIRNILDSAVASGNLTRAQAQDTLTKMGMVADIDAQNIVNNISATVANGELTLAEGKDKLYQQVTLADMSNQNKQIALESAVQAGLMTSREANDALAIATAYEDAKIASLGLKLNSLVHAGAIEVEEAKMILNQNIAYSELVEAGAARDLEAAIAETDVDLKEFQTETSIWETQVQAATNEMNAQLQQAIALGNMSSEEAALKQQKAGMLIDSNIKVLQAKIEREKYLATDENEKRRLDAMDIEIQQTLIDTSGGRLRAFMESVPGAYTQDLTTWKKNPQFSVLAKQYYQNIMGDPTAMPTDSWMQHMVDTMISPTELALQSLREQKWYQDLDTDEERQSAEAALGTLDQIGTFGGVFKPQSTEDGGGFKVIDPASGDILVHINKNGELVETVESIEPTKVEAAKINDLMTEPDVSMSGEIITNDNKTHFKITDDGVPVRLKFNVEDGDSAFGEDANKILGIGESHPDYQSVLEEQTKDYIAGNRAVSNLDPESAIFKKLMGDTRIESSLGSRKVVGKAQSAQRFVYDNLEKLSSNQFYRFTDKGRLFQFIDRRREKRSGDDKTIYRLRDVENGKTVEMIAGPIGTGGFFKYV